MAFHPQTDGQTERANADMKQYLQSFVCYQQEDWAAFLSKAEFAENDHGSEITGTAPLMVNYGYHMGLNFATKPDGTHSTDLPATMFAETMDQLHDHLPAKMRYDQDKQEQHANTSYTLAFKLAIDDKVWMSTRNIKTARPSKKLDHKRLGPFAIDKVINSHVQRLVLPPSMKIHPVFHVSLLDPASKDPV